MVFHSQYVMINVRVQLRNNVVGKVENINPILITFLKMMKTKGFFVSY